MSSYSLQSLQSYFRQRPNSSAQSRDQSGYRAAAVLILLNQSPEGDLQLILTRRSDHLKNHAGQISLPGGSLDKRDKSLIHTALREAEEEIGIDASVVEVLGELDMAYLPSGFCVTPVVGYIKLLPELRPDPSEVDEIFHIPLGFVLNTAIYKTRNIVRDGIKREFYYFDYKEYYVWGATAGILRSFAKELQT